jgi:hypothetical protein
MIDIGSNEPKAAGLSKCDAVALPVHFSSSADILSIQRSSAVSIGLMIFRCGANS